MPHLPNLNPIRPGPGPEQRLRDLQRRFRAVSARHDRTPKLRSARLRRAITALIAIAALLAAYPAISLLVSSPWPVTTTLKHIASAPNCDFARLVGLAPARRGEPGYWQHHDRDGDGVACEPWRPHRAEVPQRTAATANSD
ncbi:excalibur calcium-binding domain-containing protein [Bradyrhizobium sp. USDA 3397]